MHSFTYVDGDALLAANALDDGNGGRIIVWADERTDILVALKQWVVLMLVMVALQKSPVRNY